MTIYHALKNGSGIYEPIAYDLIGTYKSFTSCLDFIKFLFDGTRLTEYACKCLCERLNNTLNKDFQWINTSLACPEQYDIYYKGDLFAFFHLRYGVITVYLYDKEGDLQIYKPIMKENYGDDEYTGEFESYSDRIKFQKITENILLKIIE